MVANNKQLRRSNKAVPMKLIHFHLLVFIFISSTAAATAAMTYAKPGCKDRCESVKIPYPFGIGENCSHNKWYSVDCHSSKPYLSALNKLEVLYVNFNFRSVTVNNPISYFLQNPRQNSSRIFRFDLGESPFLVDCHNRFIFHGCGTASISNQGVVLARCSTICDSNNTLFQLGNIDCNGVNCCQASITNKLRNYNVDVRGLQREGLDGGYGHAFLVDEYWYAQGMFVIGNNSFVPLRLKWTVNTRIDAPNCYNDILDLGNGISMDNWRCYGCGDITQDGNPYLSHGCKDTQQCTRCKKLGGHCDVSDTPDGPIFKCYQRKTPHVVTRAPQSDMQRRRA